MLYKNNNKKITNKLKSRVQTGKLILGLLWDFNHVLTTFSQTETERTDVMSLADNAVILTNGGVEWWGRQQ